MNRTGRTTPATARSAARSAARPPDRPADRSSARSAESVRITSAQTSHSERIHGRQTRYLVSMGVRTVCFILAVVTDGTLRWVLIIAAVVLPYFAVIAANAGGEVDRDAPDPFYDDSRLMLEAGGTGGAQGTTDGPADGPAEGPADGPAEGPADGPTKGDHTTTTDEGKSAQTPSGN